MGIALATISLENGSPWLAAKKTATSIPWYVVSQEAMTTKVDCNEGARSHHTTTNNTFFIASRGRERLATIAGHVR
jgi:hypothetical protein